MIVQIGEVAKPSENPLIHVRIVSYQITQARIILVLHGLLRNWVLRYLALRFLLSGERLLLLSIIITIIFKQVCLRLADSQKIDQYTLLLINWAWGSAIYFRWILFRERPISKFSLMRRMLPRIWLAINNFYYWLSTTTSFFVSLSSNYTYKFLVDIF